MVGTNDIPSFPASTYESNLRSIIETTINAGVIPVVSTLPPRPDYPQRVAEYNAVVVRLTQEYRSFDFLSPWEGDTPFALPGDEKAREG